MEVEPKMSPFRVFGAMSVVFGCAFLAVIAMNKDAPRGGHHLGQMFGPTVVMLLVGIGLLLHQKVAAAVFILICAGTALRILISAIARTPLSWEDFVFAAVVFTPSVVSIVFWRTLDKRKGVPGNTEKSSQFQNL
jgi:hypothetical protein